jgi:hypothetical protein
VTTTRVTPDSRLERILFGLGLLAGVSPLWATHALPMVDLPQHLHLISALHRLGDPTTLYPELFARRPELTPYLGYYYVVSLLSWLMPLELANRVFLTAYVAGLPLSLAFLLRALKRPAWPALLALPFAYGDSFAWGFINYCAALPLTFLTCGFFVRAIEDVAHRLRWAVALAFCLVAVLLMHVQAFAYLGVALPVLLLTTPAAEGRTWRARRHALAGVLPGVVLFILWVGIRVGAPAEVAPGQPWKSWGPMLSEQNLSWKTFDQNLNDLVPMLANMLRDGSDMRGVYAVGIVAAAGIVAALVVSTANVQRTVLAAGGAVGAFLIAPMLVGPTGPAQFIVRFLACCAVVWVAPRGEEGEVARWRILGLLAVGFVGLFCLPFDIRGYMYYLNTRYVHLIAAVAVCCVPPIANEKVRRALLVAAAVAVAYAGVTLAQGFSRFDAEAEQLMGLVPYTAQKPRVMGLIYNTQSMSMTHPVFLHASTVLARERGGVTNFSFALTPHSPVMYRGTPPPTFPSEWRPDQMNWDTQGSWYDHFVVRGADPRQIFGSRLDNELTIAAQSGSFFLVRKR